MYQVDSNTRAEIPARSDLPTESGRAQSTSDKPIKKP